MSTTLRTRGRLAARLVSAAAAAVVAGLGGLAALPAEAAGSYYLHAARDSSYASTSTNNGWAGRSYAQHGRISVWSAWYSASSWAKADSGTSNSYRATVQFAY
jgi:hypothetical protein